MVLISCGKCENRYDTERTPPKAWMDTDRCPKCGQENQPQAEVIPRDGNDGDSLPDVRDVLDRLDDDGKGIEFHYHEHHHNDD